MNGRLRRCLSGFAASGATLAGGVLMPLAAVAAPVASPEEIARPGVIAVWSIAVWSGDPDGDRDEPRQRQWYRFCADGEEPLDTAYWGEGYRSCGRPTG